MAANPKPLAIELFAGSFGWSAGWLSLGGRAIGFDLEHPPHHRPVPEGAKLVLQDVLTLHGSQFKDAAVIFASPPCQKYSWLAMPWSRSDDEVRPCGDGWEILNSAAAKELRETWEREGPDNRLFDACFRIQREAIEATALSCYRCAGGGCESCGNTGWEKPPRHIPLIVENVRGAQPWVGRSRWHHGSFHLWGDVPALMPINLKRGQKVPGFRFDGSGKSFQTASVEGSKNSGGSWFAVANNTASGHSRNPVTGEEGTRGNSNGGPGSWFERDGSGLTKRDRAAVSGVTAEPDGTKIGGDWFSDPNSTCRKHGSRSSARKAASALIARIPLPLSDHLANVFFPRHFR